MRCVILEPCEDTVLSSYPQEPLAFLGVIVSICTMSPAQLGWDTSITVFKEQERYTAASLRRWQPGLSYQAPFNTKKEGHY